MSYLFLDKKSHDRLQPFSLIHSFIDSRIGLFSLKERWQRLLKTNFLIDTVDYLQGIYGYPVIQDNYPLTVIDTSVLPLADHLQFLNNLPPNHAYYSSTGDLLVAKINSYKPNISLDEQLSYLSRIVSTEILYLCAPHELLIHLNKILIDDFIFLKNNSPTLYCSQGVQAINSDNIWIDETARLSPGYLNAQDGPIIIGPRAVILEGACIRGTTSIGEGALIKMGAMIYGTTAIGHNTTIGGEIKNAIVMDFSNKGHDGYIGDSIIAEWCNLGAGTIISNLRNDAGIIKLWNPFLQKEIAVGIKMGALIGAYSKLAIHSSINSGSYIGISNNIFGADLCKRRLDNFIWGNQGTDIYQLSKALESIAQWKQLKNQPLEELEKQIITHIFKKTYY
ncbi:MAG: putative sugar nucleotidyl transferase [Phycisphaerales bacterium]|nr:putative sugar nucleotidyl transferase [Phycisphaerales bacterium]